MARPPLDVGTYGKIRFSPTLTGVRARASYRGYDGKVRDIERTGTSQTAAAKALKLAIAQQLETAGGEDLTSKSRFSDAAKLWLAWQGRRVTAGKRAPGTLYNYKSMLKNHVLPAFGELRLFEVTVSRLDKFFPAIQAKSSPAHARTARAVVGGVLRYAVRKEALRSNPMREIEPIEGGSTKKVRALTPDECVEWLALLASDPDAQRYDLHDLMEFMLATGARIGEALAVTFGDIDFEASTVRIEGTVVRVKGEGLVRKSSKTRSSMRTVGVPKFGMRALVRRRREARAAGRPDLSPIFPDSLGGWRDPSNTRRAIRTVRSGTAFEWLTSHVHRKTVATILDDARVTARLTADQLGHAKPSMTQDNYMARGVVSPEAAAALDEAFRPKTGGKPGKAADEDHDETP